MATSLPAVEEFKDISPTEIWQVRKASPRLKFKGCFVLLVLLFLKQTPREDVKRILYIKGLEIRIIGLQ